MGPALAYCLDADRRARVEGGLREHCRLQKDWQLDGLVVCYDKFEVALNSESETVDVVAALKAAADCALVSSGLESISTTRWEEGFEVIDVEGMSLELSQTSE